MLSMRGGVPPHLRIRGPLNSASAECGATFTLSISSPTGASDSDQITGQVVAPVLGDEGQDRLLPPSTRRSDEEDCDEYPDDENYVTTTATTTKIPATTTATLRPTAAPVIPDFILQFWDKRNDDLVDEVRAEWKQDAVIGLSDTKILTRGRAVEEGQVQRRRVADLPRLQLE